MTIGMHGKVRYCPTDVDGWFTRTSTATSTALPVSCASRSGWGDLLLHPPVEEVVGDLVVVPRPRFGATFRAVTVTTRRADLVLLCGVLLLPEARSARLACTIALAISFIPVLNFLTPVLLGLAALVSVVGPGLSRHACAGRGAAAGALPHPRLLLRGGPLVRPFLGVHPGPAAGGR